MRTSISAGSTYRSLSTRAVIDRHYAQSLRTPRRQIPSAALADDRLQQQRYLANEKHSQQQEEDEWLQSVQAEADADPRNQYWAVFAQTNTAAASQTPFETAKQPQMLGTTLLGRQRLQQKADSFADMMHLVASADMTPADRTDMPQVSSARATGATLDDIAVTGSQSKDAASTSQTAADQELHKSLSRHSRHRTRGMQNVDFPPTATGDHQIHLQPQHGSTATLRSNLNHKLAQPCEVAEDANAKAEPQSNTESCPISTDHGRREDCNGLMDGSSATGQDVQSQQSLTRAQRLQLLEAAAAKWRQKAGSSNPSLASQLHMLNNDCVTTLPAIASNDTTHPPEAQSGHLQHAFGHVESVPSFSQNVDPGAGFEAARPEHDDPQPGASPEGVPPPPSRPPKTVQAKPKASWMAALRGDAPPWLL